MTILQKHLVFIPLFFVAFIALFGCMVMLLWNWLMPDLFGLSTISFCQAAGLLLLCKILFGGIAGGHHGHGHGHHHCCGNKLRERWENMTAEEREQFIEAHRKAAETTENGGGMANDNLDDIIKENTPRLRSYVRTRISNRDDAEDIVQDTFYQLVRTISIMDNPMGTAQMKSLLSRIKQWLSGLSFRTGVVVLLCCIPCYILSFAQMLLPISTELKGVLWFILFGMAKTFQYGGLTILGVEGVKRLKRKFKK